MKQSMKPIHIDSTHTSAATGPVRAEMPPMLKSTSAGQPAAMKNTCHQLTVRTMFVSMRVSA